MINLILSAANFFAPFIISGMLNQIMTVWFSVALITFIVILFLFILLFESFRKLRNRHKDVESFYTLRKTFFDADYNMIYLKDENLRYMFVNKAFEEFFQIKEEDIIGRDDYEISDNGFAELKRKTDRDVLEQKKLIKAEIRWNDRVFKTTKFPVRLLNGKTGVGAYIKDATEEYRRKKEQKERYEYLSYHDSLTGLYNRRYFEEALNEHDTGECLPVSIIMGDVNGLKMTNDIFGHAFGDQLLIKVAEVLRRVCREKDIIARWGGDEFVLLLPNTKNSAAREVAHRIKSEFAAEEIKAIKGSISVGCDTKQDPSDSIMQTLENAEDMMYSAKTLERDDVRSSEINSIIGMLHNSTVREKEHSIRVSELCQELGKALNLPEIEFRRLKEAGYFHDIGKIVLKPELMNKNHLLTNKEWNEVKRHSVVGYRILNSYDNTIDLAESVLAHHERWDGSGYPKGLKGEEIPRLARIIAIVEYYDRMTHDSDNLSAISKADAIQILRENAGILFDPELVEVFAGLMGSKT